uniref:GG12553 n=2 Tax=Drosophila erecta TaxID=7220 RepID=B3P8R4_DROER
MNKEEKLQYDTSNFDFKSLSFRQDAAVNSLGLRMDRFTSEIERNANYAYFMRDTSQLYQKMAKTDTKISAKYEQNCEMPRKLECSVEDTNDNQNKPRVQLKKDRLKLKYMEALRLDESLEARVKHSAMESSPDMEEQQAELRKLHKDQVEVHKGVQEEIMACFKRDMDDLMKQYDAEYSRLRKVNSGWMNQQHNPTDNTHQP